MPVCAVITCKYGLEGHDGAAEGIDFHPFPKEKEIRAKWVDMTGREDWEPTKTDYVCSRHFRENDYTVKRSGKKYLKTSAIPCEYVVYPLSIFADESSEESESNEAAVKEEPLEQPEEESLGLREQDIFFHSEPTTSRYVRQEPDSTYHNDTCEPWEHFQPGRDFSQRLPPYLFAESAEEVEVGSSEAFDGRYGRDVGSALNPYPPVDLGPHLQQLPLPRTPEPPILDEDTQDSIAGSGPSPQIAYQRSRAKLETIRKIVSKRKSSKKLIAAALAVVDEAQSLQIKLQTGVMNDHDKATAVIALQNKQIAKLHILYKRQRKKLKKISAVLRNE